MASTRFVITLHALSRFVERYAGIGLKVGQIRLVLRAELDRGVPFGGQVGKSTLYVLPCGLVAAVAWNHGRGFVKTVLTRGQAIANMESGAILRFARPVYAVRDTSDAANKAELRGLAERHFHAGIEKKERNAILREHGFDPAGEAGDIYRAAYNALIEAMRGSAA